VRERVGEIWRDTGDREKEGERKRKDKREIDKKE